MKPTTPPWQFSLSALIAVMVGAAAILGLATALGVVVTMLLSALPLGVFMVYRGARLKRWGIVADGLFVIVACGSILGYDLLNPVTWTELDLRIQVCDAHSGMPIPGAQVGVSPRGEKQSYDTVTGSSGWASCAITGESSGLGLTRPFQKFPPLLDLDQYAAHAKADGYVPGRVTLAAGSGLAKLDQKDREFGILSVTILLTKRR